MKASRIVILLVIVLIAVSGIWGIYVHFQSKVPMSRTEKQFSQYAKKLTAYAEKRGYELFIDSKNYENSEYEKVLFRNCIFSLDKSHKVSIELTYNPEDKVERYAVKLEQGYKTEEELDMNSYTSVITDMANLISERKIEEMDLEFPSKVVMEENGNTYTNEIEDGGTYEASFTIQKTDEYKAVVSLVGKTKNSKA